MKKFITLLTLLALAAFLTACGESSVEPVEGEKAQAETTEKEGSEEESTEETAEKEEAKEQTFTIGDTVQFDDLKITLLGVREVKDEFMKPENAKYLAVELEIENTGDESAAISTMMNMQLMSSDGYQQDQALVDVKGSLDTELGPGRKIKGEIAFDAEEAEYYEFIFEDAFTTGQAIWKLQASDIKK